MKKLIQQRWQETIGQTDRAGTALWVSAPALHLFRHGAGSQQVWSSTVSFIGLTSEQRNTCETGSFKAAHHWGKSIDQKTPGFCHKSCLLSQFKMIHNGRMWPAVLHIQIRQIKTATACLRVYEHVSGWEIGMTGHYPHTQQLIWSTKLLQPQQLLRQDSVPQSCIGLRNPTWSLSMSRLNPTIQSAEASFLHAAHKSQTGRGWDDPAANQRGGGGESVHGQKRDRK